MSFEVVLEEPDVQYYVATYGDGQWAVAGGNAFATATDPFGTWTTATSGTITDGVSDLAYGGGYWVASTPGYVYTATDPLGTWTEAADFTGTVGDYTGYLAFDGTEWARLDLVGNLHTASDPTGTWTYIDNFGGAFIYGVIAVVNGEWVVCGWDGSGDTLLYSAASPSGAWTLRANLGATGLVWGIGHSPEGYWISVDGVYTATSLDGPWLLSEMGASVGDASFDLLYDAGLYAGVTAAAVSVSTEELGTDLTEEPFPAVPAWQTRLVTTGALREGVLVSAGYGYGTDTGYVIAGRPGPEGAGAGWGMLL